MRGCGSARVSRAACSSTPVGTALHGCGNLPLRPSCSKASHAYSNSETTRHPASAETQICNSCTYPPGIPASPSGSCLLREGCLGSCPDATSKQPAYEHDSMQQGWFEHGHATLSERHLYAFLRTFLSRVPSGTPRA